MVIPTTWMLLLVWLSTITATTSTTNDVEQPIMLSTNTPQITYVSCNFQRFRPSPFWNRIQQQNADVLVWGGDAMYADQDPDQFPTTPATIKRAYDELDEVMKSYKHLPPIQLAVWDDHDYGKNDGDKTFVYKKESQHLFLTRMLKLTPQSHPHRFNERHGVYSAQTLHTPNGHKIRIILLDVRFNKDPWHGSHGATLSYYWPPWPTYEEEEQDRTMLGEQQWAWLERVLCNDEIVHTNLVVSGLQMLAEGRGAGESWSLFPKERTRLLDLLGKCRARGVLLMSGDVHFAEVEEGQCGSRKEKVVELTSSGMTHSWGSQPAPHAPTYSFLNIFLRFLMQFSRLVCPWRYVQEYYLEENYMTLKFNLDGKSEPSVTADIWGVNNVVITRTYLLNKLDRTGVGNCTPINQGMWDNVLSVRTQLYLARMLIVLVCFVGPFIALPYRLVVLLWGRVQKKT